MVPGPDGRGVAYAPPAPLPPGRNRVEATVKDQARNEATTSWTFVLETIRPPVVIGAPAATPAAPTITSPKSGDKIVFPLVIRGTAPAGLKVEVTVELVAVVREPLGGRIAPVAVPVSTEGAWEARIALPVEGPTTGRVTITAVTVGPSNTRSEPVRLVLDWR
jgi:hypothetical protein